MSTLFHRYLHKLSSPPSLSSSSSSSIITFLTKTLNFPKSRATHFTNRFSSPKTNPQSVILFLQSQGFNQKDIQNWVTKSPQILFSDIDKTLKPRLHFFQELGLYGQDLCKFISKNPVYLTNKFEERLKPCIDVVKRLLLDDYKNGHKNENLVRVLKRCNWVDVKNPVDRVCSNVRVLEECGIVGSQLAMVITRQPRLLVMGEVEIKELVSKVLGMGFSVESRMLVHGVYTFSCLSDETFERKFELFRGYGFSKDEFLGMFRKAPGLLRVSEVKLRLGIEFLVDTVGFHKEVLVHRPTCLMLSMEERVIPRYKILSVLMSKGVLKKMPKFLNVMWLPEDEFLEKFVSKNRGYAEELLLVYKSGD